MHPHADGGGAHLHVHADGDGGHPRLPPHADGRGAHLHAHRHGDASFGHRRRGPPSARLGRALALVAAYGLVEAGVGLYANSLALLSDAAHMLTDGLALALAWMASRIAARPANPRYSFGFERAETLAAFVNALSLLVLLGWLAIEGVRRLLSPRTIEAGPALVTAALGLVVNLVLVAMLRHDHGHANSRAAMLHVLGDLAASVAAIVAMAFAWWGGVAWVDAALAILIAVTMVPATLAILRASVPVLMDAVPQGLDFGAVGEAIATLPGVRSVHDLHVWQMTADRVALSAHVGIDSLEAWPATLALARGVLKERFGIEHSTLQPEPWRRAGDA